MRTIERTDPLPESGDAYRYDRFTPTGGHCNTMGG